MYTIGMVSTAEGGRITREMLSKKNQVKAKPEMEMLCITEVKK